MSRGHGWIQRKILEGLDDGGLCFLLEMVFYVFDTEKPTRAQYKSVARAVNKLEMEGHLGAILFHWNPTLVWLRCKRCELDDIEESQISIYRNSVNTSHRYYSSRKHYPKWSKQIIRLR